MRKDSKISMENVCAISDNLIWATSKGEMGTTNLTELIAGYILASTYLSTISSSQDNNLKDLYSQLFETALNRLKTIKKEDATKMAQEYSSMSMLCNFPSSGFSH